MAYSDEPRIIKGRPPLLKLSLGIAFVLLIAGAMLAIVGGPLYHDYLRQHTPHGPNHGSVYKITLDGQPASIEIGRIDYQFVIYLDPIPPKPEDISINIQLRGSDLNVNLPWNQKLQAYGPTEKQFDPMGDFQTQLTITRGDTKLWSGTRWAFGESGHHH